MLPPSDGGLHYGAHGNPRAIAPLTSAPAVRRRAPLRRGRDRLRRQLRPRAPAVRRRAPLRQPDRQDASVPGRGAPAVRRRAPLRQPVPGPGRPVRRVLPPSDGGLHCGNRYPDPEDPYGGCSCRPTAGSIAAGSRRCSPRSHRSRAPALEGGLHCGRKPCGSPTPVPVGLPPFSGGLLCGAISCVCAALTMIVLPPFSGGLHCGTSPVFDGAQDSHGLRL